MRVQVSKSIIAGLAALVVSIAVSVAPTPAAAQWHGGGGFHGGGWHGGGWGGGWRGGGWGGWRGGYGWGWRRAGWGWGPGWGGGWGWGGGCWNCGWGWGWGYDPGWAIAATAVPVGVAIAANASQPVYGGDPGCWTHRRVWTKPGGRGRYLGRRLVNICG
jgi:hypothetical protein